VQVSEQTKQIAFRGGDAYRRRIQQLALDRGMKVQQFLEAAVEAFVTVPSEDLKTVLPRSLDVEETQLLEGVLDMMRHPRDKQDEFVVHALQEILKIRNNAKRARKS